MEYPYVGAKEVKYILYAPYWLGFCKWEIQVHEKSGIFITVGHGRYWRGFRAPYQEWVLNTQIVYPYGADSIHHFNRKE